MEQEGGVSGCLNDDSQQEDPFSMLHRYLTKNIEMEELLKSGWTREGILLATESEDEKQQIFSNYVNGLTKSEDEKLQLFNDKINSYNTLGVKENTMKVKKKKKKIFSSVAQHVVKSKDGANFGSYFQSFLDAQATESVATSSEKNDRKMRESLGLFHTKHDDKEFQYSSFDHSDRSYSDDEDVDKSLAEVFQKQVVDGHQNSEEVVSVVLGEMVDHVVQQLDEGVDSGVVLRYSCSSSSSHILPGVMNGIIDDNDKSTAKATIGVLDEEVFASTTTSTTATDIATIYPFSITNTATTTTATKKNSSFKKRVSFADTKQADLDAPPNDYHFLDTKQAKLDVPPNDCHSSDSTLPVEDENNLIIMLLMISLVLIYALVNRLISYRQKRTETDMKRKRKSKNRRGGGFYYNNNSDGGSGTVEIV